MKHSGFLRPGGSSTPTLLLDATQTGGPLRKQSFQADKPRSSGTGASQRSLGWKKFSGFGGLDLRLGSSPAVLHGMNELLFHWALYASKSLVHSVTAVMGKRACLVDRPQRKYSHAGHRCRNPAPLPHAQFTELSDLAYNKSGLIKFNCVIASKFCVLIPWTEEKEISPQPRVSAKLFTRL